MKCTKHYHISQYNAEMYLKNPTRFRILHLLPAFKGLKFLAR
jgi:hypothetical protein